MGFVAVKVAEMSWPVGFGIALGRVMKNDPSRTSHRNIMTSKTFIAVDLGAGSGRVIAATTDFAKIELEEVHRFDNPGTDLPGGSFWNLIGLYREILEGLRRAVERHGERSSRSASTPGAATTGCWARTAGC